MIAYEILTTDVLLLAPDQHLPMHWKFLLMMLTTWICSLELTFFYSKVHVYRLFHQGYASYWQGRVGGHHDHVHSFRGGCGFLWGKHGRFAIRPRIANPVLVILSMVN